MLTTKRMPATVGEILVEEFMSKHSGIPVLPPLSWAADALVRGEWPHGEGER